MKCFWKRILLVLVCVFVVGVGYVGCQFFRAMNHFFAEDQIVGTYYPVIDAIVRFDEQRGQLPKQLADLVPGFIAELPATELVDRVDYSVEANGEHWRLELYSIAHGQDRIYSWRSSGQYSEEEEERIMGHCHEWVVLGVE